MSNASDFCKCALFFDTDLPGGQKTSAQRIDDRPMSSPSLVKLGQRTPDNRLLKSPQPKIARRDVLNGQ